MNIMKIAQDLIGKIMDEAAKAEQAAAANIHRAEGVKLLYEELAGEWERQQQSGDAEAKEGSQEPTA
jgi:hypothetical protein